MTVVADRSKSQRLPGWSYGHRGYALMISLRQLTASRAATLLTLLVLGVTMALPSVFLFATDDAQHLPIDSSHGKSMTVYLSTDINDLDGAAIADSMASRSAVANVEFISRNAALEDFQRQSEFADALDVLEENPLPAAIVVYPRTENQSSEAIKLLANQLMAVAGVDSVQFDLQWVERLAAVVSLAKAGVVLLAVFLTMTALIVIVNTLRLVMLQRRRELEVTELLGATRHFTSRPYLYLGLLYGLMGGSMAIALATLVQLIAAPSIHRLANAYGSHFALSLPSLLQCGAILGLSVSLGLLGAYLILLRQLGQRHSMT